MDIQQAPKSSRAEPRPDVVRKLVLYTTLSLDGVAEEPSDWLADSGDNLIENLGTIIGRQNTVVLGRRTYDYWVDSWPTSTFQPFADFINTTPKHVVTSTELRTPWVNSTWVEGPVEQHVTDLKRSDGGDIGVHGSIRLAQSLLQAELVDELRLVVAPTIAGAGRRLVSPDAPSQHFELVGNRQTANGTLLLAYRKKATPGSR
jgi:dihydrofolate reductase